MNLQGFVVLLIAFGLVFAAGFDYLPFPWLMSGRLQDGDSSKRVDNQVEVKSPLTVEEARSRAKILHETLHGALQVMHRDFFRKDEALTIPSRSLEDVFSELESSYGITLRWLAVETKAMSSDHEPESDFEKQAVEVLQSGKSDFEAFDNDRYQYAGRIRLSAVCLTCHFPGRPNNDDRFAGLSITMPVRQSDATDGR